MNGDEVKKLNSTINKSSYVSIGLVIVIVAATFWITSTTTKVEADVESNSKVISTLDEDFVPRRELELMVGNIQASVTRIEEAVGK